MADEDHFRGTVEQRAVVLDGSGSVLLVAGTGEVDDEASDPDTAAEADWHLPGTTLPADRDDEAHLRGVLQGTVAESVRVVRPLSTAVAGQSAYRVTYWCEVSGHLDAGVEADGEAERRQWVDPETATDRLRAEWAVAAVEAAVDRRGDEPVVDLDDGTEPYRGQVTQKAVLFGPEGDVLLVRSGPAYSWIPAGGRVDAGESVEEALRRELREELGVEATVHGPVATLTDVWHTDEGESVFTVVYRAETDERAVELNDEHEEWQWFDPAAAADEMVVDGLERAVERAAADRERDGA